MANSFNVSDSVAVATTANQLPDVRDYQYGYDKASGSYDFNSIMNRLFAPRTVTAHQEMLDKAYAAKLNEYMDSTRYQRAVKDLEAAGLNPWLALSGQGGISAGSSSGNYQASNREVYKRSQSFASSALKVGMLIKILASIV